MCPPQNKNNHFNCNGCVWGAAAVAGSPGLRWHWPPGRGGGGRGRGGYEGDEVVGRPPGKLQGGAVGERGSGEAASAPRCQPRELQLGQLLAVSSLASGDNWRCSQCKHVSFFVVFSLSLSSIFTPDQSCVPLLQSEVLRRRGWRAERRRRKKKLFLFFLTF